MNERIAKDGVLGNVAGRDNQGKSIMHTIDPSFITGIGDISAFGHKKYHMRNFLMAPGMRWSSVYESLLRHLFAFWAGEDDDLESGLPHILHAGWNLMCLYTYWHNPVYHPGDDRPSKVEYAGKAWNDNEAAFQERRSPPPPKPDPIMTGPNPDDKLDWCRGKFMWAYSHKKHEDFMSRWRDGQISDGADIAYWAERGQVELHSCEQNLTHVPNTLKVGRYRIPTLQELKGTPVSD